MVTENLKELTKDLIHLEYRIDIHKLEDDCFFISDFYTIVNDQNNEIEITVFEKGNKNICGCHLSFRFCAPERRRQILEFWWENQ